MQFPITQRLTLLRDIMLRRNVTAAELRICWLLLMERTNAETGLCYCSDQHLANTLGINIRTIERAKQKLKNRQILTWTPGNHTGTASIYRFIYKVTPVPRPGPLHHQHRDTPDTYTGRGPGQTTGTPPSQTTPEKTKYKFYAKFGSPQLAAWSNYERHRHGQESWRDRRGGRWYPTEYPPQ